MQGDGRAREMASCKTSRAAWVAVAKSSRVTDDDEGDAAGTAPRGGTKPSVKPTVLGPFTAQDGNDVLWQTVNIDTGYRMYAYAALLQHT